MIYYIKLDANNIIVDVITYPHEGYIQVTIDGPLPAGINGGWYKWTGTTYQEDLSLKPTTINEQIAELQAQNAKMLLALVTGGLM